MIGNTIDNVERFLDVNIMVDSIKWLRIALVQVFLTWPLLNQTGWCSRTLSDSLLVVRPMYDVPQEHVNEYTQKLVVKQGILSLSCEVPKQVELKWIKSFAAL